MALLYLYRGPETIFNHQADNVWPIDQNRNRKTQPHSHSIKSFVTNKQKTFRARRCAGLNLLIVKLALNVKINCHKCDIHVVMSAGSGSIHLKPGEL